MELLIMILQYVGGIFFFMANIPTFKLLAKSGKADKNTKNVITYLFCGVWALEIAAFLVIFTGGGSAFLLSNTIPLLIMTINFITVYFVCRRSA